MSRDHCNPIQRWAHSVLDDVRAGHPVSIQRIKHALRILGDLT